ncbi:MAG: MCE family protein [Phycisphaerae bacterium]|nr:MCE family protein [Phycisphaerae bacterium]
MTSKSYYANVGIFTIVSAVALVSLVLLLSSGSMFAARVKCETYLVGSVNGLQVGSPVKFNGVPVGQVTGFGFPNFTYGTTGELFERKPYDQWVTVYFDVKTPHIKSTDELRRLVETGPSEGLRAQPSLAGITGGAFVQLTIMDHPSAPPAFPWKPDNIYIPSAPSTVDKFLSSIEKVAQNLSHTDFQGTIARVDTFFVDADTLVKGELRQLIREMRQVADNLDRVSQNAKTDLGGAIFGQPPPQLAPSNPGSVGK